jgi:hypothetical protein
MKTIRFIPGDTNYRWDFSENSPFLKRSLTLFSPDKKLRAKSLNVKKRYYALYFINEKEAYLSRNQMSIHSDSCKKDPQFVDSNNLPGSMSQIRFNIQKLLEKVIKRLENNPESLFEESARIASICQEEGYEIPTIEAFMTITNWQVFMHLLYSLQANKSKFKFELLLAAITQYAFLCGKA